MVGWLSRNSYAVPTEVGKVGTESPTFIEPVQKRKDGIEAMFSRQAKAAQQRSAVRDAPSSPSPPPHAAAASGKRKREPSSSADEVEEVKGKMGTSASSAAPSPFKRSVAKEHPIKVDDDSVDSEGNSDVEILLSHPSSPPQAQSVRSHPALALSRTELIANLEECSATIKSSFKDCQAKDKERGGRHRQRQHHLSVGFAAAEG